MRHNNVLVIILAILSFSTSAFCGEISGWVKTDKCIVTERPSGDSKVLGIIKKKAAVTVEDLRWDMGTPFTFLHLKALISPAFHD
jgi:hypothetical protein